MTSHHTSPLERAVAEQFEDTVEAEQVIRSLMTEREHLDAGHAAIPEDNYSAPTTKWMTPEGQVLVDA